MTALPADFEVINPPVLTTATAEFDVAQVAELDTFDEVPSVKFAVAVICCVCPAARDGSCGAREMEVAWAGVTVRLTVLL